MSIYVKESSSIVKVAESRDATEVYHLDLTNAVKSSYTTISSLNSWLNFTYALGDRCTIKAGTYLVLGTLVLGSVSGNGYCVGCIATGTTLQAIDSAAYTVAPLNSAYQSTLQVQTTYTTSVDTPSYLYWKVLVTASCKPANCYIDMIRLSDA